jgi:hypothetical protein
MNPVAQFMASDHQMEDLRSSLLSRCSDCQPCVNALATEETSCRALNYDRTSGHTSNDHSPHPQPTPNSVLALMVPLLAIPIGTISAAWISVD